MLHKTQRVGVTWCNFRKQILKVAVVVVVVCLVCKQYTIS